jgi:hypothetical protein
LDNIPIPTILFTSTKKQQACKLKGDRYFIEKSCLASKLLRCHCLVPQNHLNSYRKQREGKGIQKFKNQLPISDSQQTREYFSLSATVIT